MILVKDKNNQQSEQKSANRGTPKSKLKSQFKMNEKSFNTLRSYRLPDKHLQEPQVWSHPHGLL